MLIYVSGEDEIGMVLRAHPIVNILSIGDTGSSTPPLLETRPHSRWLFDDVTRHVQGYQPLSLKMGHQLAGHLRALPHQPTLVHCAAGISRSAAVAGALACLWLQPTTAQELQAHMGDVWYRSRPWRGDMPFSPNPHVQRVLSLELDIPVLLTWTRTSGR